MKEFKDNDPLLAISVAAEIVNLHPRTLMLYEKNGLIKPKRTSTGRRRYSRQDLKRIKFIHYLADKKNVNLAGVKVILAVFKAEGKRSSDLKNKIFPEYQE